MTPLLIWAILTQVLASQPEEIRNGHERDPDQDQQYVVCDKVRKNHQCQSAEQWHDSPLSATVYEKSQTDRSE